MTYAESPGSPPLENELLAFENFPVKRVNHGCTQVMWLASAGSQLLWHSGLVRKKL